MKKIPVPDFSGQLKRRCSTLSLMALGIVFGDIGTSPLYTLKIVLGVTSVSSAPEAALGLLSLIVWTLIVTVCLKYVALVMRADNDGEGGILALMSLLRHHKHHRPIIIAIGLFGAALIYGDGAITPAISVLSALEGLNVPWPLMAPYIMPIAVGILIVLFAIQSQGSSRIGWVFGPLMAVWFLVIGGLGIRGIVLYPEVLRALSPLYGFHYLISNGSAGFFELGGIFLAVTGAEALYADMGHIGRRPIRLAWYGLVLPALLLNYAGQTALFISSADADNLFFRLCPDNFHIPLIMLATVATIVASQSIIAGAFSMTSQAINLGWCPRLHVTHTSDRDHGQIYVAAVNWMLMAATITLTIVFGSSDRLAGAYGIAVSMTMLLTTLLLYSAMREVWGWSKPTSLAVAGFFFTVDALFCAANFSKILDGGWVPLVLASLIYSVMHIWHHGSLSLAKTMQAFSIPLSRFRDHLAFSGQPREAGTGVIVSKNNGVEELDRVWHVPGVTPLHTQTVALALTTAHVPRIARQHRLTVDRLAPDLWHVKGRFGFMDKKNLPALLDQVAAVDHDLRVDNLTYYLAHEAVGKIKGTLSLGQLRNVLFRLLHKSAGRPEHGLGLPAGSVAEVGQTIPPG